MSSPKTATVNDEIGLLIRAKYPIIYIVSYEERRVQQQLRLIRQEVIKQDREKKQKQGMPDNELKKWEETGRTLYYWSCTRGFQVLSKKEIPGQQDGGPSKTYERLEVVEPVLNPVEALQWTMKKETGIFVFQDLHPFLTPGPIEHSIVVRGLRDVASHFRRAPSSTLILLSPVRVTPPEVEKEIVVVDYPLPSAAELEEKLSSFESGIKNQYGPESITFNPNEREEFMQKAVGLTYEEVENVWARALERDGNLGFRNIDEIIEEKRQAIQKSGLLEYYPAVEKFDGDVGGLDGLKDWLRQRKSTFGRETQERKLKLPIPKGILLIGIPGCGKSLSAKAVAAEWRVPLVRLDVGRLYNSMLGKTEENFRNAIKVVEQLAPVILWVDEVEKGFPQSSGAGDSGVSTRVLGSFLNWMQEKEKPVFVVATANNIEAMPPELTRKGRFDEIFYVGLPGQKEREEIFVIHLKRWGLILGDEDIKSLAVRAKNFTGAEIEQVVESSLWTLSSGSEVDVMPSTEMIIKVLETEIQELRPMAQRLKKDNEAYQEMHRRSQQLARPASGKEHKEQEGFPQYVEYDDWRYQQSG